ncbi:Apolipoprotein N-acyltransferase (ALP N-acyltransferase) [Durusdinium trenchii]|uniref:Apolipoprotein N-acyltransferase (ALP N-acyltransferase) n=1 Tax=Durusdinium trenchii TaxID=1381693 RepID=A0ABP0HNH5_9DINO
MSTISMLCCCLLAEWLEQLWAFLLCLVPVGIMLGLSTWGYLQVSALAICVALQIPLTIAYLAHRWLTQRHPELWSVTLAFPCINTALWVLSFFFLPIGSIASPAYDLAGQSLLLTQCSAWFGRSGVTFILSWLAAAGAHRCANSKATGGFRASLATLFVILLAGGVRFYAPTVFMGMTFIPPGGEPSEYHRVSCLSYMADVYNATKERLDAGDTIIMHTEQGTDVRNGPPVPRYQELLREHYDKTRVEALAVLSFFEDKRSWYHLVTRNGSVMSYAKNHPVPVLESGLLPGIQPPSVASVTVGAVGAAEISVTGTICFDTDFPSLTRSLSTADVLLESSATWGNIGRQHLHGHQYAAVENGQTLVKCTYNGFTGAINPYGSIVTQLPQTTGVVTFLVPRFPKLTVFPMLHWAFDSVVSVAACLWLLLALVPQLSCRLLGGQGIRSGHVV